VRYDLNPTSGGTGYAGTMGIDNVTAVPDRLRAAAVVASDCFGAAGECKLCKNGAGSFKRDTIRD